MELTEEGERHVAEAHPDLLPAHGERIADTLADPDEVRRSRRANNTRLLVRWIEALRGGKHVVVVIVTESAPARRHWM